MIQRLIKQTPWPQQVAIEGSRRRRLRAHPEPFARLDFSHEGCRFSLASREAAARMTIVIGPDSEAEGRYLDALGYAERCHLLSLRKRGCAILMAPTVALGRDSGPAAKRRGRSLTPAEQEDNEAEYGADSGVIAIYDPEIDALVMPTAYTIEDPEHAVLHELGHALTLASINKRGAESLLEDLPPGIARHIAQPGYRGDRFNELAEVMAEAYAWYVVGRASELPPAVMSALHGMLPSDVELFADPL